MFIETNAKESMDIVSAKRVELYDSLKKRLAVEKYSEVVPRGRVLPTKSTLVFEIANITLPPEVEAVKDMCKATGAWGHMWSFTIAVQCGSRFPYFGGMHCQTHQGQARCSHAVRDDQ